MQRVSALKFTSAFFACLLSVAVVDGQQFDKTIPVVSGGRVDIVNRSGRVEAIAVSQPADETTGTKSEGGALRITAKSNDLLTSEISVSTGADSVKIEVIPSDTNKRINLTVSMPAGMRLNIETGEGEVRVSGDIASAEIVTDTGTIVADVPTHDLQYNLQWTASRPRYLSDFELEKVKERAAGRFQISGKYSDEATDSGRTSITRPPDSEPGSSDVAEVRTDSASKLGVEGPRKKRSKETDKIKLNFRTARGIILINVPANEVSSDLRERPLTEAAKAIIRSGDSHLMEAIRRAAPKFYGDYTRTLPPIKLEPTFAERPSSDKTSVSSVKVASVRVSDVNNRAVADISGDEFEVIESGAKREVLSVRPSTAPFNLVLLLDVSGSVENYVDFIRKAARSFVNTVDVQDKISIVTFRDDVAVVSKFTTDKKALSESLDTFDAGGATAYYDALAYTVADTLRPLKGERTAVVVLTDGDDNRSFLPFSSMLSSIQESGALIYPLYVPSGLIAAGETDQDKVIDALRARYLQGELTSKAKDEGKQLASVSGGVYYQINRLSEIQTAYEDIVRQLRTAYEIEFRSALGGADAGVSPRLRIRTKRPNTHVQIRTVQQLPGR